VLLQSLELAEKKFQARPPETARLRDEEQQLQDYRMILKRDHEGLLDKQTHLQTAIDRLGQGQPSSVEKEEARDIFPPP
jgi:hypothetical protein